MRCHTLLSQRLRSFALCVFALVLLGVPAANAGPLDDARAAGHLGEGADGYLHPVNSSPPDDVKALMKSINSKRRQKYQEIAAKQGAPLNEVAAQAGSKLVGRTPAGQYFQDASGKMQKK